MIPASRVNPISRKILSNFPLPNTTTVREDYAQKNLFLSGGDNPVGDNFYNLTAKVDASALARNYPALLTKRDPLWPPLCKAFRLATPRGIRRG